MSDTRNCPFCSQGTEPISKNGGNHYLFKCPNCGTFLMYDAIFRKMSKGEYVARKSQLLEFIKQTPTEKIAYIGYRIPTAPGEDGMYREYRPLKDI